MSHPRLEVTDLSGHRRVVPIDQPLFSIDRLTTPEAASVIVESVRSNRNSSSTASFTPRRMRSPYTSSRSATLSSFTNVPNRELQSRMRHWPPSHRISACSRDTSVLSTCRSQPARRPRQIAALLDGLRALGSGKVLDEVLTLVMDLALDVTDAERGFIMLADARGELEFKIARGKGRVTLPGKTFATSFKIPREVFSTGENRLVGDLLDPSLADAHRGTVALGIRYVLCVPLRVVPYGTGGSSAVQAKLIRLWVCRPRIIAQFVGAVATVVLGVMVLQKYSSAETRTDNSASVVNATLSTP